MQTAIVENVLDVTNIQNILDSGDIQTLVTFNVKVSASASIIVISWTIVIVLVIILTIARLRMITFITITVPEPRTSVMKYSGDANTTSDKYLSWTLAFLQKILRMLRNVGYFSGLRKNLLQLPKALFAERGLS